MIEKLWAVNEKNIQKYSVFWNVMSSGINSVVSMFLLLVVTRTVGVVQAGIFSLGFSTAQMMLTIGNYGMRNFQVTDLKNKYSMKTYLTSRIVTNLLMMIISIAFVLLEAYSCEKAVVTLLLCSLKATDAFDDIYGGIYQKNGRLDISGKLMSLRIISYVLVFLLFLSFSHNLILACIGAVVTSGISLFFLIRSTKNIFDLECPTFISKDVYFLLKECFPLCCSTFLLLYIGNAPKYAIDNYLSDTLQACYNYLFMPCFIINLFVGFALQPLLLKLSKCWIYNQNKKFIKLCVTIYLGALGISMITVLVGRCIGGQLLSLVFGIDLTHFRNELTILLLGGAFYAFSVISQVILTVMRKQNYLFGCYGIASVMAFFISDLLVEKMGIIGASFSYTIVAGMLFLMQMVMILVFYKRAEDYEENKFYCTML